MTDKDSLVSKLSSNKLQKFGRFLSGMVMPNIGAFIAWGLLTAFFVPQGWWPNEHLARLIDPMIYYLLPLLIGFTGGKMVYGHRGGVLGTVATMGMIVSTSIPMFAGAMVVGPLAGWIIKKVDKVIEDHIPSGFEMISNNFSAGILGGVLAISAFYIIGPVVEFLDDEFGLFVQMVVDANALPLISLIVEPAKVLFLNNAINHGVFTPIGIGQAADYGTSIFFLLETNPGPGLGILLVYYVFSKGMAKQTAPGAIVIHFLGGIHEIYFPYILMQPKLLIAVILGGSAGVLTFSLLGAGLIAVPSPGSIVSMIAMSPKGGLLPVVSGILVSTLVTFIFGALLVNRNDNEKEDLGDAKIQLMSLKGAKIAPGVDCVTDQLKDISKIKKIAVACDAGMGSSAMGASKLRTAFIEAGLDVKVFSCPIEQLDESVDLVITHQQLSARAVAKLPQAYHIAISNFVDTSVYQELVTRISEDQNRLSNQVKQTDASALAVLSKDCIKVGLKSMSKEEAIQLAGQILFEQGYVEESYKKAMLERESDFSTYIGNGVAIPHGTSEGRKLINRSGICILQFPDGIDFNGKKAFIVVGIAAIGNQHLNILSELAKVIEDKAEIERLKSTNDLNYIHQRFLNVPVSEEVNNKKTKLVIFDCDGVLVDSEIISAKVLIEYLSKIGIDIDFDYVQQYFLGRSFASVKSHLTENFDIPLPDDLEECYRKDLLKAFDKDLQSIDGIEDVLKNLSVDYCLASSSSRKRINSSLASTALTSWFDGVIFTAYEVENGKPAPDLFLHAAKTMGYTPDECLVIEDSFSGLQAGLNAKMEVMHFVGGSHLKGMNTQKVQNDNVDIPVIKKWSNFFELRPILKR